MTIGIAAAESLINEVWEEVVADTNATAEQKAEIHHYLAEAEGLIKQVAAPPAPPATPPPTTGDALDTYAAALGFGSAQTKISPFTSLAGWVLDVASAASGGSSWGPNWDKPNGLETYEPGQVAIVDGKLVITAKFSGGQWISGAVTPWGIITIPADRESLYESEVQQPDSSHGPWAGAPWFLPGPGTKYPQGQSGDRYEEDLQESGYLDAAGAPANTVVAIHYHYDPNNVNNTVGGLFDAGVDLSAAPHVYGLHTVPGEKVEYLLDGKVLFTVTPGMVKGLELSPYPMVPIHDLQIAAPADAGWHTTGPDEAVAYELTISAMALYLK